MKDRLDKIRKREVPGEQRSPEWFEARKRLLTASDAAAILGIKPFQGFKGCPRKETMKKKLDSHPIESMALEHGVANEPEALSLAMEALGETANEFGLIVHPEYPWLAASPDGVTSKGHALEIKCPLRRTINPGEVPHHYMPQVQVQLECLDLPYCLFIEYKPGWLTGDGRKILSITPVERNRGWPEWARRELGPSGGGFQEMIPKFRSFFEEYMGKLEKHCPSSPPASGTIIVDDLYDDMTDDIT
jgi:putative phage-type endonuclease